MFIRQLETSCQRPKGCKKVSIELIQDFNVGHIPVQLGRNAGNSSGILSHSQSSLTVIWFQWLNVSQDMS